MLTSHRHTSTLHCSLSRSLQIQRFSLAAGHLIQTLRYGRLTWYTDSPFARSQNAQHGAAHLVYPLIFCTERLGRIQSVQETKDGQVYIAEKSSKLPHHGHDLHQVPAVAAWCLDNGHMFYSRLK